MFHYHKKKMYHRNLEWLDITKEIALPMKGWFWQKCVMMIVIFISFQRAGGSLEPKTRRKRWEEMVLSIPSSPPSLCWTSPRNSGCPSSLIPLGLGPETWVITLILKRLFWFNMYLSPSWRFNSFTSLFKSAKHSLRPFSLGRLGINWRRSFKAASSISDLMEEQLDCCISSWVKKDRVQVFSMTETTLSPLMWPRLVWRATWSCFNCFLCKICSSLRVFSSPSLKSFLII